MTSKSAPKQAKRRDQLKIIVINAGWSSWTAFETAVKNGVVKVPSPPK